MLRQLLEELNERLSSAEVEAVLRSTGRRFAAQWPLPRGELHTRVEAAVSVLNALGGLAELEREGSSYVIQGYRCPLADVALGHPEVCHLAETLLTSLVDASVQARCEHGEAVCCHFIVPAS